MKRKRKIIIEQLTGLQYTPIEERKTLTPIVGIISHTVDILDPIKIQSRWPTGRVLVETTSWIRRRQGCKEHEPICKICLHIVYLHAYINVLRLSSSKHLCKQQRKWLVLSAINRPLECVIHSTFEFIFQWTNEHLFSLTIFYFKQRHFFTFFKYF